MSERGVGPAVRSGSILVEPSGGLRFFDMAALVVEWPSIRAWLAALPVPLDALIDDPAHRRHTQIVPAPDGTRRRFSLTISPAEDGGGCVVRVERTRAMEVDRLREVLDILDDLAWSIDSQYRLTAFNRSFERAFTASLQRPPRLDEDVLLAAVSSTTAAVWQDFYDRALSGERVQVDLDEQILGTPGPVLMGLSLSPLVGDGRVNGVACFLRDLTALRIQSQAVQRQNAMLAALSRVQSRFIGQEQTAGVYDELLDVLLELTGSPFGFLGEARFDAEGQPSLMVTAISDVAWDDASRRRQRSAAAGGMVFERLDTLFGHVLTSARPVISNAPHEDARSGGVPPGHITMESFLGLPCLLGDRLVGMVAVANRPGGYDRSWVTFLEPLLRTFANIVEARHSERRRQEAELALQQAKEAAEQADRAKGEFLASMSHEIRTPLNAVMGLCELALDVAVDADQKSLLRAARTNSETLLNLISDILDFSRIDAGRVELDRSPFDLRRLVEDVAETMAVRAEPKGIAVVAAVQPRLPSPLIGDAHRMRQVLTNLVQNAVKYTEAGEVVIEVAATPTADEVRVRIDVIDTGLGIPPAEHERIFERFHRVRATADVGGGGTGLGLSITKMLVEHMQGSIGLESAVGEGSRFTVELPLGRAPDTLDDGPPPWILAETRVALVHPPAGDGPQIERLLVAFGAQVARFERLGDVDTGQADVILSREPVTDSDIPAVHIAPVQALRRASTGPRLTRPVRRDALIDAVITAAGLDRQLDRSPSLHPQPAVRHCAVLLVEDHPDNRAVARRHLERNGHLVDVAEHGGVAVARARETAYDVVLMDLHMPEVDGFEAVRRIRAQEERTGTRPVPIVAVTAHATAAVRQRCFEIGFDGFVPKPVTSSSLLEAVERFASVDPVALIVDDAADSRRLLVRHLRRALPLRLRVAEDGASARAAIEASPPQLALIDATLPDESGFELAAWLRDIAGPDVTIIMVTGRTDAEARRLAQEAGCDGFVAKPVDRRILLSEIEARMPRSRPRAKGSLRPAPLIAPPPATTASETAPMSQFGVEVSMESRPPDAPTTPAEPPSIPTEPPTAPAAQVDPPVEVAYVDPDLLDLIPPFLQDRRNDLARIALSLHEGDMVTIARLGHSMKGSGRAYGMPHVSDLGRRIEKAAREGDLRGLDRACDALAHYVDTVEVLPDTP